MKAMVLDRVVALKVLRPVSEGHSDQHARFRKEVDLLVRFPHPALVTVLDARLEHDPPFMVSRWMEGGDLGWLKLGQLPSMFIDTVKTMQVGDISDLIRSSGSFHIIKLMDRRGDERHFVDQTKARHILIKPDELNSDADVQARIRQLEIRLRGGEDFATIALANSQDTLSAARGGDLGWLNQGDTVPEFEEAMNKLAPGELSPPVKTEFGWHLIEVQERRTHDSTEEYERTKVQKLLRARKYDEELILWMRRLRDESYVEYRIDMP